MAENGEKRDPSTHRTPGQIKRMASGYNNTPAQIKAREERNLNRAHFERAGRVHKGDGKDIDHKKALAKGGSNSPSNLRVIGSSANRRKGTK